MCANKSQSGLDILVIGAGLGGLSAAICLAHKGHKVRVLESSKGLSEFGAGIQVTPNATRILSGWGLKDALGEYALEPACATARRYSTGEPLGVSHQNPDCEELYGFPYWQIFRPDFQRVLAEHAVGLGVEIQYDCRVFNVDCENGSLGLESGLKLNSDLIICADGVRSTNRPLFQDNEKMSPRLFNEFTYRAMIDRQDMMSDSETAKLIATEDIQSWLGPDRAIVAYPISRGTLFNVAVVVSASGQRDAPVGKWNEPADLLEFQSMFSDFCPLAQKLVHLVKKCAKWTIAEVPPLPTWSMGKAVLLGDAAHAMSPHAAQGAAMAIEDAAVLGECLNSLSYPQQLGDVLKKYECLRKPRVERVAEIARNNGSIWVLSDGPQQEARDKRFKESDEMYETFVKEGRGERPKAEPDEFGKWPQPGLLMWLYGTDAVKEAQIAMAR